MADKYKIGAIVFGTVVLILIGTNVYTLTLLMEQEMKVELCVEEVKKWARHAAAAQEHIDFMHHRYRVYKLTSSGTTKKTSQRDGPFQVWRWSTANDSSWIEAGDTAFVTTYNVRMRSEYAQQRNHKGTSFPKNHKQDKGSRRTGHVSK